MVHWRRAFGSRDTHPVALTPSMKLEQAQEVQQSGLSAD